MMMWLLLLTALSMPLPAVGRHAAVQATADAHEVVFSSYAPLSRNSELLQRLLTPLNARRVRLASMQPGHGLQQQSIDLKQETYALHVPTQQPPRGYGLLVFVPPWPQASVPPAWIGTLDRRGVIFVSAANSGNDANVLDRRVPLALLAAWNVMQRYRVDPQRVYIGGFSGGSRVAERAALGYPDLFHGALLIAGSDPVGSAQVVLPPSALWRQFQNTTRLVYLTGENDTAHLELDDRSRQSMRQACVAHVDTVIEPWVGHELPAAVPFGRALDRMEQAAPVDTGRLERCRIDVDHALDAQLQKVEQLLAAGNKGAARRLLEQIDVRFGGLAAPRSLSLAQEIAAH